MPWTDSYEFGADFADLRDAPEHAAVLGRELALEITPGHPLHGRVWTVVAQALPWDDVVAVSGEEVALVHLTWRRAPERLPWPITEFYATAAEFDDQVANRYG